MLLPIHQLYRKVHKQLTWCLCLCAAKLTQRHYLLLDITILVDQYSWRVFIWVALDAKIRSNLAKLHISKSLSKLSPDLN